MQEPYEIRMYRNVWARYWRHDGKSKRQSLGTTDRLEAERRAREAVQRDLIKQAPTFTIEEHWRRYREHLRGRPAHTTMGYEAKSLMPVFGNLLASDITDELVESYIASRRAQKRSDGTILTELNRLASMLNFAVEHGLLDKAPHVPRPHAPPPRERHLTKAEAAKLLEHATHPHLRLFISIALCTAARREAILGLTWDRVDLRARRIDFRDPASPRRLKGRAIVPMNGRVITELQAVKPEGKHVIAFNGQRVASMKTSLRTLSTASGIQDVTSHLFRHTAAVWMAESRVPMSEIAAYLGHKDSRVTEMHYARYSPDYLARAADTLDF